MQAEAYINRASLLQNESTNEQLQIHYKVTPGDHPKGQLVRTLFALEKAISYKCTQRSWAVFY